MTVPSLPDRTIRDPLGNLPFPALRARGPAIGRSDEGVPGVLPSFCGSARLRRDGQRPRSPLGGASRRGAVWHGTPPKPDRLTPVTALSGLARSGHRRRRQSDSRGSSTRSAATDRRAPGGATAVSRPSGDARGRNGALGPAPGHDPAEAGLAAPSGSARLGPAAYEAGTKPVPRRAPRVAEPREAPARSPRRILAPGLSVGTPA
jgi:hypothetical protein